VLPLGADGGAQELWLVRRTGDGELARRRVLPVSFVPLVGGAGRRG
jgi:protein-L-isoaspartate O-methyltransferase